MAEAACKAKQRPILCQVAVRQAADGKMMMESTDGVFAFFSEMPSWPGCAAVCAPPKDLLAADFAAMSAEMFRQQASADRSGQRYRLEKYPPMDWARDDSQWEEPILWIDSPAVLAAAESAAGWGQQTNGSRRRRSFIVFENGNGGEIAARYATPSPGGGPGMVVRPADLGHSEPAKLVGRANGLLGEIGMDLPRLAAAIHFTSPGGGPVVLQQMRREGGYRPKSEAPHRLSAAHDSGEPSRRWAVLGARPPQHFGLFTS